MKMANTVYDDFPAYVIEFSKDLHNEDKSLLISELLKSGFILRALPPSVNQVCVFVCSTFKMTSISVNISKLSIF